MPLSVEQCRAARALLGWSTNALADASKLGLATVRRFETGHQVQAASVTSMQVAFQDAGVTFIAAGESSSGGGEGVRLAPTSPS